MNNLRIIINKLKPTIPKWYLFLLAAAAWTIAGGMLLFKGYSALLHTPEWLYLKVLSSLLLGFVFYFVVFSNASIKNSRRIVNLPVEKPFLFAFFSCSSYLLMITMISIGITIRNSGFIPMEYLSAFYIVMGTPLFLSAFRFYYNGINFKKAKKKFEINK
jgi:hypothetical protein